MTIELNFKMTLVCFVYGVLNGVSIIINIKKCKLMHFGHSNNCFQYSLNNINLEMSNCERILGAHIDNKLTFANHVYICIKKASNVCNCIGSNAYNADNSLLIQLYKTYARPAFS